MEHGGTVSPQNSPQKVADTGNQTPAARLSAVERLELANGAGIRKGGYTWLPVAQYEAKVRAGNAAKHVPGELPTPKAGTVTRTRAAPAGEPGPTSMAHHMAALHQLHETHLGRIAQMHSAHLAGARTAPGAGR